jgi:hypothetical protein
MTAAPLQDVALQAVSGQGEARGEARACRMRS